MPGVTANFLLLHLVVLTWISIPTTTTTTLFFAFSKNKNKTPASSSRKPSWTTFPELDEFRILKHSNFQLL